MLKVAGSYTSLEEFTDATVPARIRLGTPLGLQDPMTEQAALAKLRKIAEKNVVLKSYIGMGYNGTVTPAVIQRNLLENPAWYTSYTPYQAEISQGRLELLLNFQTMVADLTGMDMSNASLLDESTAAAEAMSLCHGVFNGKRSKFFVAEDCHPQNIALLQTRARGFGITIDVGDVHAAAKSGKFSSGEYSGVLVQYPNTYGHVTNLQEVAAAAKEHKTLVVAACDLLSLTMLTPPGEWGADIAVGLAQRFGVPMGYGGPHAAFLATTTKHQRRMPGRIIGVSKDAQDGRALRMAMQTREQHIRRDRATSNICTAQALLANMAAAYGIYHGPEGIRAIAERVRAQALVLAAGLREAGCDISLGRGFFDTLDVDVSSSATGRTAEQLVGDARAAGYNLRLIEEPLEGNEEPHRVGIALDETT